LQSFRFWTLRTVVAASSTKGGSGVAIGAALAAGTTKGILNPAVAIAMRSNFASNPGDSAKQSSSQ